MISIIAVLAALLLGAAQQAKQTAQRVQCSSNLRQIGMAALQFTSDHANSFPDVPGASNSNQAIDVQLSTYLGITSTSASPIFKCPADPRALVINAASHKFARSYSFNKMRAIDDGHGVVGQTSRRLNAITAPSSTILITEWFTDSGSSKASNNCQFGGAYEEVDGWLGGKAAQNWPRFANGGLYHVSNMNFGFVDGHVAALPPEQANTPIDMWRALR